MRVQNKTRQSFSYVAPEAREVLLAGEFTDWDQRPVRLKKGKDGTWKTNVLLAPGEHQYRFLVDGRWCNDPACPSRVPNDFGSENCVCIVARALEQKRARPSP